MLCVADFGVLHELYGCMRCGVVLQSAVFWVAGWFVSEGQLAAMKFKEQVQCTDGM